jgi:hypothetical protein
MSPFIVTHVAANDKNVGETTPLTLADIREIVSIIERNVSLGERSSGSQGCHEA